MRVFKYFTFFILILVLTSCNSNTETVSEGLTEKIEEVGVEENVVGETVVDETVIEEESAEEVGVAADIVSYLEDEEFLGSVLIYSNGETILKKGFGLANTEGEIPNTPDTVFLTGSLTMPFTAVSIMMLEEQGLLNVDDTIDMYLDDFPNDTGITIHNLLTHASGLQDYHLVFLDSFSLDWKSDEIRNKHHTPNELIDYLIDKPVKGEPGSLGHLNASNYILLGCIIEKVSGIPYEEFVNQNILNPLNMDNSGFSYVDDIKNKAIGYNLVYSVRDNKNKYYPIDSFNESVYYSFAGLSSTVGDLLKWNQALANYELISKETTDKMYMPYTKNPYDVKNAAPEDIKETDPGEGYGYGWFIKKSGEKPTIYHMGIATSCSGHIYSDLDKDLFIVYLSNKDINTFYMRYHYYGLKFDPTHEVIDDIVNILNSN